MKNAHDIRGKFKRAGIKIFRKYNKEKNLISTQQQQHRKEKFAECSAVTI